MLSCIALYALDERLHKLPAAMGSKKAVAQKSLSAKHS
jgi:hypothetical protein